MLKKLFRRNFSRKDGHHSKGKNTKKENDAKTRRVYVFDVDETSP